MVYFLGALVSIIKSLGGLSMNRKLNRMCVLALSAALLNNFTLTANASDLLKDDTVLYVEDTTNLIDESNLPEYDSIESAINDESLISFDEEPLSVSKNDEYTHYEDGDEEKVIDLAESFNEEIGLTDEEVEQIYESYVIEESVSADERLTVNDFENFANYAVEHNIIEDSVEAKAAINKSVVRASLRGIAYGGGALGYTVARDLLLHSLQDSPSGLSFEGSGNSTVKKVIASSAFNTIYDNYKRHVRNSSSLVYMTSGSTTLSSPKDLHLALNKVNYIADGYGKFVKIKGRKHKIWKVKFTFTDKYDFEVQAWKNAMTDSNLVTALNNYAAYGQKIGAVVPYNVRIQFDMSFVE